MDIVYRAKQKSTKIKIEHSLTDLLVREMESDPVVHVSEPQHMVELAVRVYYAMFAETRPMEDFRVGGVSPGEVVLALVRLFGHQPLDY